MKILSCRSVASCYNVWFYSAGSGLPAQPVTDSPMDMDFTTPAYFFQMSSCEVAEGRLARFDCRVVAYPKPEIVWCVNCTNNILISIQQVLSAL